MRPRQRGHGPRQPPVCQRSGIQTGWRKREVDGECNYAAGAVAGRLRPNPEGVIGEFLNLAQFLPRLKDVAKIIRFIPLL